ncbi:hypothetical protein AG1IA_09821 [Rhizoctonia solani AG-1 IA]|uniref:Uncharacterized protein n=1 Tax=Thanatephorus cucumeris (strain AG1-IA) TaxID=983506 RepID=L8WIG7_THACA|nr:hypothetical protein AG1IA_09821 [Rhizoctonia solani AG-1 IA]
MQVPADRSNRRSLGAGMGENEIPGLGCVCRNWCCRTPPPQSSNGYSSFSQPTDVSKSQPHSDLAHLSAEPLKI